MSERVAPVACRPVTPKDTGAIEQLFGGNSVCRGCWCMHWRVEKGGKTWQACWGEPNRRAFLKLLQQGRVQGVLAFAEDKPVVGNKTRDERAQNRRVVIKVLA